MIWHLIDGIERPIAYASRSLTDCEKRYTQIDREALAIVFALDKFYMYLYGNKFELVIDNKALSFIFAENK